MLLRNPDLPAPEALYSLPLAFPGPGMDRPRAVRALWILVLAVARGAAEKCAYSDPGCVVIVCCGDSLTAGSGARDGGDWPALL